MADEGVCFSVHSVFGLCLEILTAASVRNQVLFGDTSILQKASTSCSRIIFSIGLHKLALTDRRNTKKRTKVRRHGTVLEHAVAGTQSQASHVCHRRRRRFRRGGD